MIIPLEKLHNFDGNKYIFTKAAMKAVEKIGNIKDYPETDFNWKVIPHILKMVLDGTLKYEFIKKD